MDNPFEMVFGIVLVVMIASVLKSRYRAKHGIAEDRKGNAIPMIGQDTSRLQDDIRALKERIVVLEKIATDDRGARDLENEIERLRDR